MKTAIYQCVKCNEEFSKPIADSSIEDYADCPFCLSCGDLQLVIIESLKEAIE